MRLCIISDTHTQHAVLNDKLHAADVILHCGDFTDLGKQHEVTNFMSWFTNLDQFKHKIVIAGNHDWLFEESPVLARSLVPSNIVYLEDSAVLVEGVKFYGTPVQKAFCNWAFNRSEVTLASYWSKIHDDTDVLITHSPPFGILDFLPDGPGGSPSLCKRVKELAKVKVHCFGHLHDGYGMKDYGQPMFVNAALADDTNRVCKDPIYIDI